MPTSLAICPAKLGLTVEPTRMALTPAVFICCCKAARAFGSLIAWLSLLTGSSRLTKWVMVYKMHKACRLRNE